MGIFNFKREIAPQKLSSFFKFNILNPFCVKPKLMKEENTESGSNLKIWHISFEFDYEEFGLFYSVTINQFNDSTTDYNLTFHALPNRAFPNEIVLIVKYLTDKYGVDAMGCGYITQQEVQRVNSGDFWTGRFWPDHKQLSYGMVADKEWELTLYGDLTDK